MASVLRLSKVHSTFWIAQRKPTSPSIRVCMMTLSQARYDSEPVIYGQVKERASEFGLIHNAAHWSLLLFFTGNIVQGLHLRANVCFLHIFFNLDLGGKHWKFFKSIVTFHSVLKYCFILWQMLENTVNHIKNMGKPMGSHFCSRSSHSLL